MVNDKKADDTRFESFLSIIKREASDNRNFVKKAVNWALRQIRKRNLNLNDIAIKKVEEMQNIESKHAKWLASDAIRELTSEEVQKRLAKVKLGYQKITGGSCASYYQCLRQDGCGCFG